MTNECSLTILPNYTRLKFPNGKQINMSNCVTQQILDSALAYRPSDEDIFVVSYPKCGTTWMLHIVNMILTGVDCSENQENDCLDNYYTFLDFEGSEIENKKKLIKSHLPVEFIPWNEKTKYIFIARSPKDCLVSFYYHTLGFDQYYNFKDGKFNDFFKLFVKGECDYGNYFEMLPNWFKKSKDSDNIHFVLYEDLKSNFPSELGSLAKFLGNEYKEKLLENNKVLLESILEKASIKNMKKKSSQMMKDERPDSIPFVRKGIIGDWKNELTGEQSRIVDRLMKKTNENVAGFSDLWKNYKEYL